MSAGAFSAAARAAIYETGGGRCIGCGRTDLTAQHRTARGMGGTSSGGIGSPANGVPLCGSGTTGCHGWTEHNPLDAELLGWRLVSGTEPLGAPFWTRFGWYAWAVENEGDGAPVSGRGPEQRFYYVVWVDEDELDRKEDRLSAVRAYERRQQ